MGDVEIAVVGSANVDLSVTVPRLPGPGETVIGGDVLRGSGGKGANQAVAAARLGSRVAFVGRVGDDDEGRWLRRQLEGDQVDVRALLTTGGTSTGTALIAVEGSGENSIIVSPGANHRVTVEDLDAAGPILGRAEVVLTQLEIPLAVVSALRSRCGGRVILNPAPARSGVPLDGFDIVVPNRGELALLAGADESPDLAEVVDQARSLDTPVVIVTVGSDGAVAVSNDPARASAGRQDVVTVPASPVEAVDTTAAGDSFCGALAVALAEGADIAQATRWAVRAAGITVTSRGAQSSLPARAEVGPWRSGEGPQPR